MKEIIQNLTIFHSFNLSPGANIAASLDMFGLGDKEAYLVKRVSFGTTQTSASPEVAAAGFYLLDALIAGGDISYLEFFEHKDLIAGFQIAGGALAAQGLEVPYVVPTIGRNLPTNNIYWAATAINIANAATVELFVRVDYSVVSLSLAEVNQYLTR